MDLKALPAARPAGPRLRVHGDDGPARATVPPLLERSYPDPTRPGTLAVVRVFPSSLLARPGGCGACPAAACNLSGDPFTGLAACLRREPRPD